MSVDGCEDTSTTHLMLFILLRGRQLMMPTLMAYQSCTHGNPRRHLWSFAASNYEQCMERDSELCTSARVIAQTLTTQDGTFLTLLEVITTAKLSGFVSNNEARIAWEDPLWDGAGCVTPGNTCCQRYQRQHRGQVVCRGIKVK